MAAAWLAAGSMGCLAHPLRHALTWLAAAVVLVAGWPHGRRPWKEWAILAAVIVAGLVLTVPATGVYNVLGVAAVLAVVANMHVGVDRRALLVTAFAAAVFGVFRFACATIATVWSAADAAGEALGALARRGFGPAALGGGHVRRRRFPRAHGGLLRRLAGVQRIGPAGAGRSAPRRRFSSGTSAT